MSGHIFAENCSKVAKNQFLNKLSQLPQTSHTQTTTNSHISQVIFRHILPSHKINTLLKLGNYVGSATIHCVAFHMTFDLHGLSPDL